MANKKIKLAVIRSDNSNKCPMGLPIPMACCNVGKAITRMAPTDAADSEKGSVVLERANRMVYIHNKDGNNCIYADKILEKFGKVDCDFGDTGQGQKSVQFVGSPLYPQTFNGIGLEGLYGYPLGMYSDNSESRNMFFGLFSFLGEKKVEILIKLADDYDSCGEKDKATKIDEILEKLKDVESSEEFAEEFIKLEEYLDEYKQKHENNRTDPGLLYELAAKWFGSRQVSR